MIQDDAIVSINDSNQSSVIQQDNSKRPLKFNNKNKVSLNGLNELL